MYSPDQLHVIAVVSNPVRFVSRYRLFRHFVDEMTRAGVHLTIVEHAFADRPFEVTSPYNPDHVQLRGRDGYEIWLKESLINVGVRHLSKTRPNWRKMAWIDADVSFARPDWATETLYGLDHYPALQPWTYSVDMGPNFEPLVNEWGNDVDRSFCAAFLAGRFEPEEPYRCVARPLRDSDDWRSHYGYAWAIRRDAYEEIGGLIDWMVTGSADFHMSLGFAGILPGHIAKHEAGMSAGYKARLEAFQARCDEVIRRNLGVIPGMLMHGFHGHKKDRGYLSRHDIIRATEFDPDHDLERDEWGVWKLTGNKPDLEYGLRAWFRQRNEDADLKP
jgi:hypothetical protein